MERGSGGEQGPEPPTDLHDRHTSALVLFGQGLNVNAVLNAVGKFLAVQSENAITSIARTRPIKTLWSLFSIDGHFGKLAFYR